MTTCVPQGSYNVIIKGAPEKILTLCSVVHPNFEAKIRTLAAKAMQHTDVVGSLQQGGNAESGVYIYRMIL